MSGSFYVYVHKKEDTGQVFYIGKGSRGRHSSRHSRSDWWKRVVKRHGFYSEIIADGLSETCANTLERIKIRCAKESGIELVNMTDGGDGYRTDKPLTRKAVSCSNGMDFDSISSASRWANVSPSKIGIAASGKRLTCAGYAWWFTGSDPKSFVSPSSRMGKKRRIFRSDGRVYESVKDAANSVSGSPANLIKCANLETNSAYGFGWSYDCVPDHPRPRYERASESLKARAAATRLRG